MSLFGDFMATRKDEKQEKIENFLERLPILRTTYETKDEEFQRLIQCRDHIETDKKRFGDED